MSGTIRREDVPASLARALAVQNDFPEAHLKWFCEQGCLGSTLVRFSI